MANAAADDIQLLVNGRVFEGWMEATVKRSLKAISGSFSLTVADRWAEGSQAWAILPGDSCSLRIGADTLITGYIDDVEPSFSASGHSISISGRDKSGDLVDCSAVHKSIHFTNISLEKFARTLAVPFGIGVKVDPSAAAPAREPFLSRILDGGSAFEEIEKAARLRGVLLANDGAGNILITRAGNSRAETALVEGVNLLDGKAKFSHKDRFSEYIVKSQNQLTEEGDSPEVDLSPRGRATDSGVTRYRPLIIRAEGAASSATAKLRAQWEAKTRAGKSSKLDGSVVGWRQQNGALWTVNTLVSVTSARLRVKGDLLITGVTFSRGSGGRTTQLELERVDAYSADPTLIERKEPLKSLVAKDRAR